MEVYTLDALMRRVELFETFQSLIWTDRYKQFGDFEMHIASTFRSRSLLVTDTLLAMDQSNRVMKIESVEDGVADDGSKMLTVKGRSYETIMYDRIAALALTDTTTNPKWSLTGMTPTDAARKIFHDICVTGTLSIQDIIPFIHEGPISAEPSNIAEPVDLISVDIEPTTVYDAITQLADIWNFGFRILRNGDMSQLWFDIYMGSDRTTGQTTLPAVVFSPELDNLQKTTELVTTQDAKNVAYVFSPAGFQMVLADGVDSGISGNDRRILVVNATDVTVDAYPDPGDVEAALIQKGRDALAQATTFQAFDGEISQTSQYKPGRDYNMGDLVEMRNSDGVANQMRVTEIIYASDAEGERSYPTLTVNNFINTGSWLSWLNNKQWIDLEDEVVIPYWADQP